MFLKTMEMKDKHRKIALLARSEMNGTENIYLKQ